MNHLARREVAIVSPHAGTTRDIIEVQLDLDGFPVTLIDTAGIRETIDPIEQEGVRRARARAAEADLVLWLSDAESGQMPEQGPTPVWRVRSKVDLGEPDIEALEPDDVTPVFRISARRGDGIAELIAAIVRFAQDYFGAGETALITRERQRALLRETSDSLRRSLDVVALGDELIAEELRRAAMSLGRLLGRVDVEDILDVIFREFCIGK
jgi:tRNA modification GTPase